MGTGPTAKTVETVLARANHTCERCGRSGQACQVHHRRPRGMGGSRRPGTNKPSNLMLLCAHCHAAVESSRQISHEQGWLVRQEHDPADRAVWIARRGWTFLDDLGNYENEEAA